MNSIRLLTPFERGSAAYADALCHVDYPAGSDALMQWAAGLCSALLLVELPEPVAQHGQADGGDSDSDSDSDSDGGTGAGTGSSGAADGDTPLVVALRSSIASTRHFRCKAQRLEGALQQMADELAPLLAAHLGGDRGAVHQALTVFAAQRCTVVDHSAGRGVLQ